MSVNESIDQSVEDKSDEVKGDGVKTNETIETRASGGKDKKGGDSFNLEGDFSDDSDETEAHKTLAREYRARIGMREVDIELLRMDSELCHLVGTNTELDEYEIRRIALSNQFDTLINNWNNKLRECRNVSNRESAIKLRSECKEILEKVVTIRRKILAIVGIFASKEWVNKEWTPIEDLDELKAVRERMGEQWIDIRTKLGTVAGLRSPDDSVRSYIPFEMSTQRSSESSISNRFNQQNVTNSFFTVPNSTSELVETPIFPSGFKKPSGNGVSTFSVTDRRDSMNLASAKNWRSNEIRTHQIDAIQTPRSVPSWNQPGGGLTREHSRGGVAVARCEPGIRNVNFSDTVGTPFENPNSHSDIRSFSNDNDRRLSNYDSNTSAPRNSSKNFLESSGNDRSRKYSRNCEYPTCEASRTVNENPRSHGEVALAVHGDSRTFSNNPNQSNSARPNYTGEFVAQRNDKDSISQLADILCRSFGNRETGNRNRFKPLKHELPKFSGEITEFQTWYESYQRYVERDCDDDFLKLLTLKDLLTGDAHRVVFSSLSMTAENYPQAINKLVNAFDSPALIERGFHNRLDRILTPDYHDLKGMRAVYDEILAILTAMKCSRYDIGVLLKVESKFPPEILREIGRRHREEDTERDLQAFLGAASDEIKGLEKVARVHDASEFAPVRRINETKSQKLAERRTINTVVKEFNDSEESLESESDSEPLMLIQEYDCCIGRQDERRAYKRGDRQGPKPNRNDFTIKHQCQLCKDRNHNHFEHKCKVFRTLAERIKQVAIEKRCIKCFELPHENDYDCLRFDTICPISECGEAHGLAVCPKYDDFANGNKGNFSMRKRVLKQP